MVVDLKCIDKYAVQALANDTKLYVRHSLAEARRPTNNEHCTDLDDCISVKS